MDGWMDEWMEISGLVNGQMVSGWMNEQIKTIGGMLDEWKMNE